MTTIARIARKLARLDGWACLDDFDIVAAAQDEERKDRSRWMRFVVMAEAAIEIVEDVLDTAVPR